MFEELQDIDEQEQEEGYHLILQSSHILKKITMSFL